MIFHPSTLAAGWRGVALAAAKGAERPALASIRVEQYPHGVRLVASDSYMLLTTWVPDRTAEDEFLPEPDDDEAPIAVATVMDPHGRGKGLLAHAQQLAKADPPEITEVHLSLGVVIEDTASPSLAGMETRWCIIEISERERVKLQLYDGEYPTWRSLFLGYQSEETKAVALNLEILAKLAKLPKITGHGVLGWEFGGANKMARVELLDSFPAIAGVVMPCRWDLDRNAPADQDPDLDDVIDVEVIESGVAGALGPGDES